MQRLEDRELANRMGRQATRLIAGQFDSSIYLNRLGAVLETAARVTPLSERSVS